MPKYLIVRPSRNSPLAVSHKLVATNSDVLSLRNFIHNYLRIPEGSLPFAPDVGIPEDYLNIQDLQQKLSNKFSQYGSVRATLYEDENGERYVVVTIGDDIVSVFTER